MRIESKTTAHEGLRIGEALRWIRRREGLTMTAAVRLEGAPDLRTLSAWESRRELPAWESIDGYLAALGVGVGDLAEALERVERKREAGGKAEFLPRFGFIDAC